ncbi:hypothetical protein BBBOND_0200760 [Babesia bigemina]|uniref:Uncharacterized protein n=1 Tax=Babesia bigemina TaxID=5866 RepID=A0A061D7P4_BABBI|nr:hypothetical protein BBBOND_0200760 [Babesia bigemina]CDR94919.1 hypothetical protein BBBOND_0200760 [Babesia bigemina]|eukprot:XP_012767105.1 hypothetical protein BBBOND_0200760 [Babesia bigemina]
MADDKAALAEDTNPCKCIFNIRCISKNCDECDKGFSCPCRCCQNNFTRGLLILLALGGGLACILLLLMAICHMIGSRTWPFHKIHDLIYGLPDIYDPYVRDPPKGTY